MSVALDKLIANALGVGTLANRSQVAGVTSSSTRCEKDFLFVATKGASATSRDGHDYIDAAIEKNASAVVVESGYHPPRDFGVPLIVVRNSKLALCHLVEEFYDRPSHKLKVIGITGTNGKTSTSFMLHNILKCAGHNPKIMGTLGAGDPHALTPLSHTTMEPEFISAQLAQFANDDVSHVIMEISSHALCLNRVEAIKFAAVGLTNITQDHLDFHGTLENYRDAKARLFFDLADDDAQIILPDDHPFGDEVDSLEKLNFYSPSAPLCTKSLPLRGGFQIKNALLASTIARALAIPEHAIDEGLRTCPSIPGRLEEIKNERGILVFVDFAHTPHALEELLTTLKALPHRRLLTVFGCGGDREREKRPMMGAIAARYSDVVIVTDDNPRRENPARIRQEIIAGIAHEKNAIIHEIACRKQAIRFALEHAHEHDVVVIAGKGHESYQIYGDDITPFADQDEVRKVLETL